MEQNSLLFEEGGEETIRAVLTWKSAELAEGVNQRPCFEAQRKMRLEC